MLEIFNELLVDWEMQTLAANNEFDFDNDRKFLDEDKSDYTKRFNEALCSLNEKDV